MTKLLPCPFCGGEAQVARTAAGYWAAYCEEPMCGRVGNFKTEAEAIEAWNTRAERTCEYVIEDNMNESEGMGDVWFRCTNCGACYDYYADDWLLKMSHCPNCGARVTPKDSETTPKVVSE